MLAYLFAIVIQLVAVVVGFALLFASAEALLRGAVAIAIRHRVSQITVGVVLIGFGTSLPEMMTAISAALHNSSGLVIGNVVGSNLVNILGVFGLALFLSPPNKKIDAKFGAITLLVVTAVFLILCLWGVFSRFLAVLLLVGLGIYLRATIRHDGKRGASKAEQESVASLTEPMDKKGLLAHPRLAWWHKPTARRDWALAGVGLLGVLLGAQFLITGSVTLARLMGVSEVLIGLTLVAVGTSLPELAAAWAARGRTEILLGNIIGSNVFNLLGVLGVGALIYPVVVPREILQLDLWVLVAATLCFVWAVLLRPRLTRVAGAIFLIGYGVYIATLFVVAFSS